MRTARNIDLNSPTKIANSCLQLVNVRDSKRPVHAHMHIFEIYIAVSIIDIIGFLGGWYKYLLLEKRAAT